jgi:hypothetical protein
VLAVLHSFGNILAATSVGMVLSGLSWGLSRLNGASALWLVWLSLLVALLYLPREMGWTDKPPLLQSIRQVPSRWARCYPPWQTALMYGLGLGCGFGTRIVVPTFYLLVLWPFLLPGSWAPVGMWMLYGCVRSLPVWWMAATTSCDQIDGCGSRLAMTLMRSGAGMHRVNGLLLAVVAICLLRWSPSP